MGIAKLKKWVRFSMLLLFVSQAKAFDYKGMEFDEAVNDLAVISKHNLMKNISPKGALPGTVIAAPSMRDPDYYYHWVRDAALTMDVVLDLYEESQDSKEKSDLFFKLNSYVDRCAQEQQEKTLSGMGEPKFYVDGRGYDQPWGRPQNDGPALRALTLIRFAKIRLADGDFNYVRARLYDSRMPSGAVIKRDLEYVSEVWQAPSFDLWEEENGQHYYTKIVQAKALEEGAKLARQLGDTGAANWYDEQSRQIRSAMMNHIDTVKNRIRENMDIGEPGRKPSGLDAATLLGHLHTHASVVSDTVINTLNDLESEFTRIYRINSGHQSEMGTAIGRYPEDVYYGGNPWVLTTLAFAQLYYQLANESQSKTINVNAQNSRFFCRFADCEFFAGIEVRLSPRSVGHKNLISNLRKAGDSFLKRTMHHLPANGSMWEQYDRNNGYVLSAPDLTWSYASYLTAIRERKRR